MKRNLNRRTPVSRGRLAFVAAVAVLSTGCSGPKTTVPDELSADRSQPEQHTIAIDGPGGVGYTGHEHVAASIEAFEERPDATTVRLEVVDVADSVLATIKEHPDLTTFASLVANFPQQEVFTQARGVTLFIPNDAAFNAMDPKSSKR